MRIRKSTIAALIAMVLVTVAFAGCVSEGDEDDWNKPTQVFFESGGFSLNETDQKIDIDFSLGDKGDKYTKADGTLRVAIWDSDDFEMLNKTYEIKSKDFFSIIILGLKATGYSLEIPFSDMAKSHDWGYNGLGEFTERKMHAMIWFTYKDETFSDEYNYELLNPEIPEALLHPNDPPMGDLVVTNDGFVGMAVMCDASGSTDPEGGSLDFDWDWGDGDTTPALIASAEEDHVYDAPGTYTLEVTITDPEGATDTKTMDVTVDWVLTITVNDWGVVTEGEYVNQTFVDLSILNNDDEPYDLTGLSFWLLDDGTGREVYNVSVPEVPSSIDAVATIGLMVYFDLPEGYVPTQIETADQFLPLE